MSYLAIKWTYMSPTVLNVGLNPTQLAVLRALCWFYKDEKTTQYDKNCYVSVEKLAKIVGKDADSVSRAKAILRKKGLIRWDRAANFDKNAYKPNNYQISCPELEKKLQLNERRRNALKPLSDEYIEAPHPLPPGGLYDRPDQDRLAVAFPTPLDASEAKWMADALAFVSDKPEHRKSLYEAMRKVSDLNTCREALNRCMATSSNGRKIMNRFKYLLVALRPQRSS